MKLYVNVAFKILSTILLSAPPLIPMRRQAEMLKKLQCKTTCKIPSTTTDPNTASNRDLVVDHVRDNAQSS